MNRSRISTRPHAFTRTPATLLLIVAVACGTSNSGESESTTDASSTSGATSSGSSDSSSDTSGGQCPSPELPAEVSEQDFAALAAALYCDTGMECMCPNYANDCYQRVLAELETDVAEAQSLDLTWDGACAEQTLQRAIQSSCLFEGAPEECFSVFEPCRVYFGAAEDGQACASIPGFASDCAQGLDCDFFTDTCEPFPDPNSIPMVGEGEPCVEDFEVVGRCDFEQGFTCDVVDTGMCVQGDAVGEPCTNFSTCVLEAWCDEASEPDTCVAKGTKGESCGSLIECEAPFGCYAGQCWDLVCGSIDP